MSANNSQLVIKVAVLLLFVSLGSGYFGTGPYEIKNIHVNTCEDQGTNEANMTFQMYRTQDRTNRVLAHRGGFTISGGNKNVFVKVFKKGTDWILVTDYEDDYCEGIKHIQNTWDEIWEAIGYKNMSCPPITGHYTFEELILHVEPMTPALPYGEFKVLVYFRNENKEVYGCLCIFADIVKKFL